MLTQADFRTNDRADQCPQCASDNTYTPGKPIFSCAQVLQDRWCDACGFAWTAVFCIAGYVRPDHEDEDFDELFLVECVDRAVPCPADDPA